jgi:uncharacterized membrane protein SirB2/cytochrome c5
MYKGFLHTHTLVVTLFLIIYVVKTILLLSDKTDLLAKFTKKVRIAEMIISSLFLITGIYLATTLPFGGKYDYLFFIKVGMVLISIPLAVIGFKRSNKTLAALSLLLITGSYGLAEVYSKRKGTPKDTGVTIASNDGKSLYEAKCSLCHGNDGKHGTAGALDLSITKLDAAGILEVVSNGRGAMPKPALSAEEANAITEYVQSSIKEH